VQENEKTLETVNIQTDGSISKSIIARGQGKTVEAGEYV
jgi:hypothetical protein